MPYITQDLRETVDAKIDQLLDAINVSEQDTAGMMNYVITSLLYKFRQGKWNYNRINSAIGMLECCKLELYRRLASPYEDSKIKSNNDVWMYQIQDK